MMSYEIYTSIVVIINSMWWVR